jgi:uncharacterized Zn-binding protein involved in type VI secretion
MKSGRTRAQLSRRSSHSVRGRDATKPHAALTRRAFMRGALTAGTTLGVGAGAAASARADLARPLPGPVVPPELRPPPVRLPVEPVLKIESYFGPTTAYLTRDWIFKVTGAPRGGTLVWSGTGKFQVQLPDTVKATFRAAGSNTISVTCTLDGRTYSASLDLIAKDADKYARVGGKARCHSDAHGCPACPHDVLGPIISGSPTYLLDGLPIARVGDRGTHAACCGPNTFVIATGDNEVLVDGKAAARIGDATTHCGGQGTITSR